MLIQTRHAWASSWGGRLQGGPRGRLVGFGPKESLRWCHGLARIGYCHARPPPYGLDVHNGEMAEIVERINAVTPTWNLVGFVSPDGARVGECWCGYPILGPEAVWKEYPDALVVPGHSSSSRIAGLPRERYGTLIDPSAWVSRTARVGVGCVIYPHCFVGLNAVIGDFCFCLSGAIAEP